MKKKIFSLALALVMCMGLSVSVSATVARTQGLSDSYEIFKVSEVNKQTWIETHTLWIERQGRQCGLACQVLWDVPVREYYHCGWAWC